MGGPSPLQARLQALYFGDSERAHRFRYGLLAFDIATVGLFLLSSFARDQWWIIPLDLALGALLSLELAARIYADDRRLRQILSFTTLADALVIASLLLPVVLENWPSSASSVR